MSSSRRSPTRCPKADEVLIRIEAAALNFPDVLIVANEYQISIPPPFTPGSEFAGVITAVGSDVTDLQPGDRVSLHHLRRCVRAVRVPSGPLGAADTRRRHQRGGGGVRRGLRDRVPRDPQRRPRSSPATGSSCWARRAASASRASSWPSCSAGACSLPRRRPRSSRCAAPSGAEAVVDYETEDLKERIKEITGGGADVVIDPVGGPLRGAGAPCDPLGWPLRDARVRVG